jgi:hypothetical protein
MRSTKGSCLRLEEPGSVIAIASERPVYRATCELNGATTYDRVGGYCSARGRDLGKQMIDAANFGIYHKYNTEGRY